MAKSGAKDQARKSACGRSQWQQKSEIKVLHSIMPSTVQAKNWIYIPLRPLSKGDKSCFYIRSCKILVTINNNAISELE
jgi:hypothetical protein